MNIMPKLTPTFADQFKANPNIVTNVTMPTALSPPKEEAKEEKPLKVALIGTAPSSRHLAPFGDTSWKIWACSPGNMNLIPRVDLWFELHGNMFWPECQSYGVPYVKWLNEQTFPLYMQNQSFVARAMTFPMIQMVREFGQDFFTSTFAWMMAFAISQKAKEIALYGIDMASRDEYIIQRQGFYYFRTIAAQRGIIVTAPKESDIMQSPGLYGYSEVEAFGRKIMARMQELKMRLAQMEPEKEKITHNITYLQGAVEDMDYMGSIQIGVTNEILLQAAEIVDLKAQVADLGAKAAEYEKVLPMVADFEKAKASNLALTMDVSVLKADLAQKEVKLAELETALAECRSRKKKC